MDFIFYSGYGGYISKIDISVQIPNSFFTGRLTRREVIGDW